jgi:hypothetical protein
MIASETGFNFSGNVGGGILEGNDILSNKNNVVIDQADIAIANSQIFIGNLNAIDVTNGSPNFGIIVNDPGSSNSLLTVTGTWVASSVSNCVSFGSAVQWKVVWTGGTITNCGGDAININSTNVIMDITGTQIYGNTGWGINKLGGAKVSYSNVRFKTNTAGDRSGFNPVLSSCGTSPSISAGATYSSGFFLKGTGSPTACTLTFDTAWQTQPNCLILPNGGAGTIVPFINASTTAFTPSNLDPTQVYYFYQCMGDY